MLNVHIICDDRFDPELTYTIHGEKMGNGFQSVSHCNCCENYSECEGWAEIFGKCKEKN